MSENNNLNSNKINKEDMTEGEIFIYNFLKDSNIKFQTQVRIEHLKDDTKSYRVADFYLPNYKLYIEYFGQWNKDDEAQARYLEKKKVYRINGIPCVYLYPENLGIIEFILNYRMTINLHKNNLMKELFRHRTRRLIEDKGDLFFWLFLSIFILCIGDYKSNPDNNPQFVLFFIAIIIFQLYRLVTGYRKYFVKDNGY